MTSLRYPASGGVAVYANQAALPAAATDGTVAVTADTDTLWVYNANSAAWVGAVAAMPIGLLGVVADGSTAVATKIGNANALSTAGAKILSLYSDNFLTERASIDLFGAFTGPYRHVLQSLTSGTIASTTTLALVNASFTARTISLPLAASVQSGRQITIRDVSGSSVQSITIKCSGSDTYDFIATSFILNSHPTTYGAGAAVSFVSDGVSKWYRVANAQAGAYGTNPASDIAFYSALMMGDSGNQSGIIYWCWNTSAQAYLWYDGVSALTLTGGSFSAAGGVTGLVTPYGLAIKPVPNPTNSGSNPAVPGTPTGVMASGGTWYYNMTFQNLFGSTIAASAESVVTTTSSQVVLLRPNAIPVGAVTYSIFGRNTGATKGLLVLGLPIATNYTDNGSATPNMSITAPTVNSTSGLGVSNDGTNLTYTVDYRGKPNHPTPISGAAVVGTATLSSGTVTVSTTAVTASSRIWLTHAGTTSSATWGELAAPPSSITAGTSFVINSSNALDTDQVYWRIED
jgi:hypothetical protein